MKGLTTWWTKTFDREKRWVLGNIGQDGWTITMVKSDGRSPEFAYSTGLWKSHGHPDLIMIGLPRRIAATILHGVAWKVRRGEVAYSAGGGPYAHVLQDHPVHAVEVEPACYGDYLGVSLWYYHKHLGQNETFPTLQFVWPDRETGAFPWDEAWPLHYEGLQPLLGPAPSLTTIQ